MTERYPRWFRLESKHQATVNDNERVAPLEREPSYRARRQRAVR